LGSVRSHPFRDLSHAASIRFWFSLLWLSICAFTPILFGFLITSDDDRSLGHALVKSGKVTVIARIVVIAAVPGLAFTNWWLDSTSREMNLLLFLAVLTFGDYVILAAAWGILFLYSKFAWPRIEGFIMVRSLTINTSPSVSVLELAGLSPQRRLFPVFQEHGDIRQRRDVQGEGAQQSAKPVV
jgi:hypothetical protein